MINKVILVGNVGKDPEVRHLQNGTPVATFSLATTETYKDKSGNRVSNTEWHNIVAWRGLADITEKFIKKGHPLYIEGKITNRSYDAQDGSKRYITEIVANEIKMLSSKQSNGQPENYTPAQANVQESPSLVEEPPLETDDLPF